MFLMLALQARAGQRVLLDQQGKSPTKITALAKLKRQKGRVGYVLISGWLFFSLHSLTPEKKSQANNTDTLTSLTCYKTKFCHSLWFVKGCLFFLVLEKKSETKRGCKRFCFFLRTQGVLNVFNLNNDTCSNINKTTIKILKNKKNLFYFFFYKGSKQ